MTTELDAVRSLRRVLEAAGEGKGMSRALVEELEGSGASMSEAARMLLLGYPIQASLRPVIDGRLQEASMLASLIVAAPRSSAAQVGRNGKAMAATLERWVKVKESSKMEMRVLRFRSLLTSGVLGAVTAMVASLGPLVANLGLASQPAADPQYLIYAAAAMTGLSSAMLGYYMSGTRLFVNVGVAMAAFALVAALASPLAGVSSQALWGVK